jgi:hypothetical protein
MVACYFQATCRSPLNDGSRSSPSLVISVNTTSAS